LVVGGVVAKARTDKGMAFGRAASLIHTDRHHLSHPPLTPRKKKHHQGLANCFEKDEEGKLNPRQVVEPVSANTLESLAAGAKTSYSEVWATTAGTVAARDRAALPPTWSGAAFCTDWEPRLGAVARTWARPHAVDNLMDIVPLGQSRGGWNTSTEDKRVLNFVLEVSDDDNIKQDISIDVYGRAAPDAEKVLGSDSPAAARAAKAKATEDGGAKPRAEAKEAAAKAAPAAAAAAPPPAQAEEEEEDDLDALLNA
jgi:hypothetical protein